LPDITRLLGAAAAGERLLAARARPAPGRARALTGYPDSRDGRSAAGPDRLL